MRYQDWDVLLFPSGEESASVPVKEFRTACFAEHQDIGPMPLLTTFIPSLPQQAPFQISIHSWTKTAPILGPSMDGTRPKELLQVRILIDGGVACVHCLDINTSWPQIISTTTPHVTAERNPLANKLCFPAFHKNIMSQSHWDASDHFGRIRVELSSGYLDTKSHRFVKMMNVVTFAFQPAPIGVLEHCGVAWPNPAMFQTPLHTNACLGVPNRVASVPNTMKHKRSASVQHFNMPAGLSGLPIQSPMALLDSHTQNFNTGLDASSRSTSAYSIMPDSAAPLLSSGGLVSCYPGTHADVDHRSQPQTFRLPSDQIQTIINGLNTKGQQQQVMTSSTAMLPPPLPLHAMNSKVSTLLDDHAASAMNGNGNPMLGSDVVNFIDRREESRYSDISMHAGCNSFPTCTTEDAEGHIVHNTNTSGTPTAPATVVRGRKEGSSPTKRKLSRSTKKDDTGEKAKKRPRRSTRLLQHDSGYDGGSSGHSDERNADRNTSIEGTGDGSALVESSGSTGQEANEVGAEGVEHQ